MGVQVQVKGAAAGNMGSPFGLLSFPAKAAGTYNFTDANFSGLGKFLPGLCAFSVVPAAGASGDVQMSTDNGTTWKSLLHFNGTATAGTVTTGGGMLYLDTATTVRITYAGGACDIFLWPLGSL